MLRFSFLLSALILMLYFSLGMRPVIVIVLLVKSRADITCCAQLESEARQYDTTYLLICPFLSRHGTSSQAMLIVVGVVEDTLNAGATDGAKDQ